MIDASEAVISFEALEFWIWGLVLTALLGNLSAGCGAGSLLMLVLTVPSDSGSAADGDLEVPCELRTGFAPDGGDFPDNTSYLLSFSGGFAVSDAFTATAERFSELTLAEAM